MKHETNVNDDERSILSKSLSITSTLKESTAAALREATNPKVSRFQSWSEEKLKELLVLYNVQIRGSNHTSHETLVLICDEVFPEDMELQEIHEEQSTWAEKDKAVQTIQKAYIRKKIAHTNDAISDFDMEEGFDQEDNIYSSNDQILKQSSMIKKINNKELADAEIEVEWKKPSWREAKRFEALNRPHRAGQQMEKYDWKKVTLGRHCTFSGCGEQLDLWDEGKTSEFAQFGSGITNYFKFLKWCCWTMLMLSILHLPIIIVNTFGASLQYDSINIAATSFGNLGTVEDVTEVKMPGCDSADYQQIECTIKKDTLAIAYAFLDMIGTILVIIGLKWLQIFEKGEEAHLNRSTVTASDYTLRIDNIPKDTNEAELAVHFAKISGEAVAEVHLAYENANEIKEYFKRGKLMQKRFDIVQKIRYEKTIERMMNGANNNRHNKKRLRKLLKKRTKLTRAIRVKDAEREESVNPFPKPIQAFVTFQSETGYINAISSYQVSWIKSFFCFSRELKFKGIRLNVRPAPEPSTIIWENLECSRRSQTLRKTLTTGVAGLAILLSIVFTFLARDFKSKALETTSQNCPNGFHDLTNEEQYEIIEYDTALSHCYCSRLSFSKQAKESLCQEFLKSKIQSVFMSYGAGFMVVFMNSFFTWLMDKAGSFEKHHSIDEMEASVMARVFILKFLNTGCLVLLYNQKWLQALVRVRFNDEPDFGVTWYETGGLSLVIVMCMNIISPHVSPILQCIKHRKKIAQIEKHLTKDKETDDKFKIWYSQDDLNQQYLGPHFAIKYRYTQILVNFYVCWMYSTAMPLMPLIGAISFYVSYWVDKYLFCNFYRTPPMYSDKIGKTSTAFVGFSVVLHLIMSIWMMGNGKIFRSELYRESNFAFGMDNKGFSRLYQTHLLPLEMLLLFYILYNVIRRISGTWGNQLEKFFKCLTCRSSITKSKLLSLMNTVQVDYTSARDRGIIKGLASYNIFQNPKYQEAFAVSSEFAGAHSHLNSIRGLNTKDSSFVVRSGDDPSDEEFSDHSSDSDDSSLG